MDPDATPRPRRVREAARRAARIARAVSWRLSVAGLAAFVAAWILFPYPPERLEAFPAGRRVLDAEGQVLRVFSSSRGEFRFPVPLAEMSPWLVQATLAVEDRHFRSHPGVNPFAILRAVGQNLARGRIHSGASTLTQQLVRILDDRPRTVRSKAIEAFRALQLDAACSKDRLIEAYLNLAPYGGNLRGAEAAARRYFGKSARDLNLSEAALLAGLPQSPSRLRPDRHPDRAAARRRIVLEALARTGDITSEQLQEALAASPEVRLHPWPFRAPHLAELARDVASRGRGRDDATVRTTLDPAAQAICELRLSELFASPPPGWSELSGAVVALDAASGEVRALVGSPGYFDVARRGALDASLRPRSPGSALKPFLYALAFERGLAGPDTVLSDVPRSIGAYSPENYDRSFRGLVPAREALGLSLNIPAVALQEAVGTREFLGLLRRLGLRTVDRPAEHYGLQLTLGGCEVRLLDLAAAYACLVRGGTMVPWSVLREAAGDADVRIASAGARPDDSRVAPPSRARDEPEDGPRGRGPSEDDPTRLGPVTGAAAVPTPGASRTPETDRGDAVPPRAIPGARGTASGAVAGAPVGGTPTPASAVVAARRESGDGPRGRGPFECDPTRVLSPGACRLALECLSRPAHLARALPDRSGAENGLLGYKTGTSYGHRDAWAVAFTERWVVGVWIGDPKGRPEPGLVGAEAALPVALSAILSLSSREPPSELRKDGSGALAGPIVETAPVCALSGRPAGRACPRVVPGSFPAGCPRPAPCEVHREALVDRASGLEVCGGCRRGRAVDRRVVEIWPQEVESWLARQGLGRSASSTPPPHDPACRHVPSDGAPTILSPRDGSVFVLASSGGSRALDLRASSSPGTVRLHWFLDGEVIAMAGPIERVPWRLQKGAHEVRCVDDRGRAAAARFEVR